MRVYHYLEAKWALDNIRRRRLKLSIIDDMNDPYEWKCVRSDDKGSQGILESMERIAVEKYSAQCFSQSWNNILIWNHYGDKLKGSVWASCARKRHKEVYEEEIRVYGSRRISTRKRAGTSSISANT